MRQVSQVFSILIPELLT